MFFLDILFYTCMISDGDALLHTSWLLCLVQRAASHDNNHIQRWIVRQILELQYNKCPIFTQGQTQVTFYYISLAKDANPLYRHHNLDQDNNFMIHWPNIQDFMKVVS